jgi:hypothetical protein
MTDLCGRRVRYVCFVRVGHGSLDGVEARTRYRSAAPWPHVVCRDIFPAALVEAAEREELPFARSLATRETRRVRKAESQRVNGPSAAALLETMDSDAFVEQVRLITGIDDLQADPTHLLAGLHASGRGSFQALHTDFGSCANHSPVGGTG